MLEQTKIWFQLLNKQLLIFFQANARIDYHKRLLVCTFDSSSLQATSAASALSPCSPEINRKSSNYLQLGLE